MSRLANLLFILVACIYVGGLLATPYAMQLVEPHIDRLRQERKATQALLLVFSACLVPPLSAAGMCWLLLALCRSFLPGKVSQAASEVLNLLRRGFLGCFSRTGK
jgi:integral membrane sensor domain MASE1